jgi:hypothetical protein
MSRADGVSGAIRAAVAAAPPAEASEQAELFALPMVRRLGEAEEAFAERCERVASAVRRGPGRPKGSTNASTAEWRDWALRAAGGKHPVVEMMRFMAMGPAGLAEDLGCGRAEAFDRWLRLAGELAPYFLPKLAPTDERGNAVPNFQMVFSDGSPLGGSGVPPWEAFGLKAAEPARVEIIDEIATTPADPPASDPHGSEKP